MRALTGGEDGLAGVPRPMFLGLDFNGDASFYYLVLFFFSVILAGVAVLRE